VLGQCHDMPKLKIFPLNLLIERPAGLRCRQGSLEQHAKAARRGRLRLLFKGR